VVNEKKFAVFFLEDKGMEKAASEKPVSLKERLKSKAAVRRQERKENAEEKLAREREVLGPPPYANAAKLNDVMLQITDVMEKHCDCETLNLQYGQIYCPKSGCGELPVQLIHWIESINRVSDQVANEYRKQCYRLISREFARRHPEVNVHLNCTHVAAELDEENLNLFISWE
jgi:hypothetical protein